MLCSMTGFGEARHEGSTYSLLVELRAVNNRYLKVTVRGPDPYPMLEAEVEKVIRKTVRRGTVLVQVRVHRLDGTGEIHLNRSALAAYIDEVEKALSGGREKYITAVLPGVLQLPGVAVDANLAGHPSEAEWIVFEGVLSEALANLQVMRLDEGRAMADELLRLRHQLIAHLEKVREQTPRVIELFRWRLRDRIALALRDASIPVSDGILSREVALFADRCDINEEIARLDSHLAQMGEIVGNEPDSPGRKLEFLVQEMGREANTIGSKASDAAISRLVVDFKANLEKIRELVQNVE